MIGGELNLDISTVTSLIGSLGFPIVCCGFIFWFINNTLKDLKKTIENNTKIMTTIYAKITGKAVEEDADFEQGTTD